MAIEDNKALVRRFYEQVLFEGDLELADQVLAPDFAFRRPDALPGQREGFKRLLVGIRTWFPDARAVVDQLVAEGDHVAVRWTMSGTHTGEPYLGTPATGKAFSVMELDIWRVADERLAEVWHRGDGLGLRRQLGLLPTEAPG